MLYILDGEKVRKQKHCCDVLASCPREGTVPDPQRQSGRKAGFPYDPHKDISHSN